MNILHEDENLLIVDKPNGLPCLPTLTNPESVINELKTHHKLKSLLNSALKDHGLLHRLDNLTSGCLAIAKNEETYTFLRSQWKLGSVQKTYRAIVPFSSEVANSKLPLKITTPIGHSLKSAKRMIALTHPMLQRQIKGKPQEALSEILNIRIIDNFLSHGKVMDIEIKITTGVRHQIRVHLASLGVPIIGDPIYSKSESTRLWLHSWKLSLPTNGAKAIEVVAEVPW